MDAGETGYASLLKKNGVSNRSTLKKNTGKDLVSKKWARKEVGGRH